MEVDELEETVLNPGNDQRMIFIAANFRREVTATVLWLLSRGIRAQCFKVSPFSFGEELILDIQQIIPIPEAADFLIGMSSKEEEEKRAHTTKKKRHEIRMEFWEVALDKLREDGVELYRNINPGRDHWLSAGSGMRSVPYQMIFGKNEARVELSLQRQEAAENKWVFDQLFTAKDEIESIFKDKLDWRRMDDKKASRIVYAKSFDGFDRNSWPDMVKWLSVHIQKLEEAFRDHLSSLNKKIRTQNEYDV